MGRRGKGEGCIRKRKDGYWLVEFQIGIQANGKPNKVYKYAKSQSEAVKILNKLQIENPSGVNNRNGNITLSDWCNIWLNEYKKNLAPTTRKSYETNIRLYIDKYIGGIKLNKLNMSQIQKMIDSIYDNGNRSLSLVIKVYNVLHGALNKAFELEMISKVPTKGIVFPADDTKEKVIFTVEEQKQFIKALEGEDSRELFLTYLFTGARLGELPPLRWKDVDLENRTININKKAVLVYKDGDTKTCNEVQDFCKTKSSKRYIMITEFLADVLSEHKKKQKETADYLNIAWSEDNLVFPTSKGTMPYGRNIQEKFTRICKKANLPEKATMHSLRHTYATRLFECGVDIKVISMQLGHKNVKITYDTYVHVQNNIRRKEIDKLSELDKLIM